MPYAYDNLDFVDRPWTPADYELAKIMSAYWANFARTGNPNGPGLPVWPAYQGADKKIMMLDLKPTAKTIPDAQALDFLYQQTANK